MRTARPVWRPGRGEHVESAAVVFAHAVDHVSVGYVFNALVGSRCNSFR
jgi:hypothetical protein